MSSSQKVNDCIDWLAHTEFSPESCSTTMLATHVRTSSDRLALYKLLWSQVPTPQPCVEDELWRSSTIDLLLAEESTSGMSKTVELKIPRAVTV